MPEPLIPSNKLQWKWVGITLVLYAVFYLLPLLFLSRTSDFLTGVWVFAGVIIIAAIAGYLSEGVTIWEPAIAGAGLLFLFFLGMIILFPPKGRIFQAIIPIIFTLVSIFLLSLFGAWLGERAQILWKKKSPETV